MKSLEEKVLEVLNQIRKEKDEEMVKVDMWCHFGHAYITKVDEGELMLLLFAFLEMKEVLSRLLSEQTRLKALIRSLAINSLNCRCQ